VTTELGTLVRRAREQKGISIRELARRADIPSTTLRDIETARVRSPRVETLEAIAVALGVSLDLLMHEAAPDVAAVHLPAAQVAALFSEWAMLTPDQRELVLGIIQLLRASQSAAAQG